MLVRKAEVLIYLQKAGSLSASDEALLDLVHPLSEAALQSFMQQSMGYQQHVEYLPAGQPQLSRDFTLNDAEFRQGRVTFVNPRAGTEFLQLRNTPVVTYGLEVREAVGAYAGQGDHAFNSATILTLGSDYYLDVDDPAGEYPLSRSGILFRTTAWPAEPRSIKVTYYAGWTATQLHSVSAGAVKLAALKTVASNFLAAKNRVANGGLGPKISENIGKYGYSYAQQWILSMLSMTVPADAQHDLQPFRNYGRVFA